MRVRVINLILCLLGVILPGYAATQALDSISSVAATVELGATDSIAPKPRNLNVTSTPVDYDRAKPQGPSLHYYDKHGNPLETPVKFLTELDTVVKVKSGPAYPLFNGVAVGFNFFDLMMNAFGQYRGSYDVWASCSLFNWFFPVVEIGLGRSDAWPDDARCNFKVKPSIYGKIGFNYNFLYKSNPDYQVYVGLRAGVSSFGYDIYHIKAGSDYYKEDGPRERTGLHATCWYGQVLAGLEVKIWRGIAMGWSLRYGFKFKRSLDDPDYAPWFVPGYGTGPLSVTFSLIYRIRN